MRKVRITESQLKGIVKRMIRESIADDVSHIIEYSGFSKDGKLYAGQNSNFNQNLTPNGGIMGSPTSQYFVGRGSRLSVYNPSSSVDNSDFLEYFNRFLSLLIKN